MKHLPKAQYAYNNAENEKTKVSPFFTNYSYNLMILGPHSKESLSLSAIRNAKQLRGLHEQLAEDAEFINLSVGQYYDKKHKNMPLWKEGDKVYLDCASGSGSLTRPGQNLTHRVRVGLFFTNPTQSRVRV